MHNTLKNFSALEKGLMVRKEKNDGYDKKAPTGGIYEIKSNVLVKIHYINHSQGRFSEKLHEIYGTFYIKGKRGQNTTYCEIPNLQQ
jgi:hypothetical protein